MVKVKSLLKSADKELTEEESKIVSTWLGTKKKQIRSCKKTLGLLTTELNNALEKEVEDFAGDLLDDGFDY